MLVILLASALGFVYTFALSNLHRYKTFVLRVRALGDVERAKDKLATVAAWEYIIASRRIIYAAVQLLIPAVALAASEVYPQLSVILTPFGVSALAAWLPCWKFPLPRVLNPVAEDLVTASEMSSERRERLYAAIEELSRAIAIRNWEKAQTKLREVVALVFS